MDFTLRAASKGRLGRLSSVIPVGIMDKRCRVDHLSFGHSCANLIDKEGSQVQRLQHPTQMLKFVPESLLEEDSSSRTMASAANLEHTFCYFLLFWYYASRTGQNSDGQTFSRVHRKGWFRRIFT
jgi:hypothetical protein